MRVLCLLALVMISACTQGSGPGAAKQTPSASVSANPSPSATVSPSLSCRLPVVASTSGGAKLGWVTFPDGHFEEDLTSSQDRSSVHLPSYDRAIAAWVPVESNYVAPDGLTYILHGSLSPETSKNFYVVDAKTGSQQLLLSQDGPPEAPGSWEVVAYANEGVYLWSVGMKTVPGLWLLDTNTGAVKLVDGSHSWGVIANGAAWAVEGSPDGTTTSKVFRLDLSTGQVTKSYEAKMYIRILSPTPDGDVLLGYHLTLDDAERVAVLAGSGSFTPIELPEGFPDMFSAHAGNPGVWIGVSTGIALYVKGEGVKVMARSPYGVSDLPAMLDAAGGCG
jgi:hypothetical protein